MSSIKRIVLDVLKPHQPNALDFASTIADQQLSKSSLAWVLQCTA
jgi:hypothetical protein